MHNIHKIHSAKEQTYANIVLLLNKKKFRAKLIKEAKGSQRHKTNFTTH